jgi:hypothetical protein
MLLAPALPQLQQAASASSRVSLDAYEPAALAKCTLLELEERLESFGIHQAAAFVVSTACRSL